MPQKKRLGELLIEAGVIGETQLKAALGHQRQWGVRIGQALVDLKLATEPQIVAALAAKFGFGVARLDALEPYGLEQALKLLPRDFAIRNNVFPMSADTASFTVAMSDPTNLTLVDEIRFRTGRRVNVLIGGDRAVAEALRRHYPGEGDVEAIALDVDLDMGEAEALHDPFGGGSSDALDAFFASEPGPGDAAADPPPAPAPSSARSAVPAPSPARPAAPAAAPPRVAAAPAGRPAAPAARGSAPRPREATARSEPPAAAPPGPEEATAPPLTPREVAILAALDRLAGGAHAEPEIVKPTQAMAALVRILLRKRIIDARELLDELARR